MELGRRSWPEAHSAPFLRKEIDVARNAQAVVPILMPPALPRASASIEVLHLLAAPSPRSWPGEWASDVHGTCAQR